MNLPWSDAAASLLERATRLLRIAKNLRAMRMAAKRNKTRPAPDALATIHTVVFADTPLSTLLARGEVASFST